jgi:FixJ family two-component response regulator
MAALDAIAAGKAHCDFVEVPQIGTTTEIFDAVQGAVQFLCEPFKPNDIDVVDRAYAKLGETRQSIRQNEVALEILQALIVKR